MESNTVTCTKCGQQIPADAIFCPLCGFKLKGAPTPAPESTGGKGDLFLLLSGIIVFAYAFIYMIIRFIGEGGGRVIDYTLGLALYAVPLLCSFGIKNKGTKVLILIFGIVTLVIYLVNQVYYSMYYYF
ncbi:MAG: zinc ribbon domain-containing protein [Bacteroidetes bacterium]|nr:zinc ribbon domain-containing protein [Bacteroidota bacterium]